jgi:thioredoxin reductase
MMTPYDVVVVGGGPAGVAAALWAARYRRSVLLIDAGQPRNRWSQSSHGYLGFDGQRPTALLDAAREDLACYHEVEVRNGRRVVRADARGGKFELVLDDGRIECGLRVVLATGVADVFPDVAGFEACFGTSIFTCPSCDGYAARGKAAAVVGASDEMAEFALGLLDWARSVVLIRETSGAAMFSTEARTAHAVDDTVGRVVAIDAVEGQVRSLVLDDGRRVDCEVVFWPLRHVQQSDLAEQLGCETTADQCLVVDADGETTVSNVYAAGDITPGPHLVQIAASEGARAGIAAATSLRGERGSPRSPAPAPT